MRKNLGKICLLDVKMFGMRIITFVELSLYRYLGKIVLLCEANKIKVYSEKGKPKKKLH